MSRTSFVAAALLSFIYPASCRAQADFSESISVQDMGGFLQQQAPLFKEKEGSLKRAGILDPKTGLAGEVRHMVDLMKELETGVKPMPGSSAQSPAGNAALSELESFSSAKPAALPEVDKNSIIAFDKDGRRVEKSDDETVRERIEKIADQKVQAAAARKSFTNLLWAAYRVALDKARQASPEVGGLFTFLKAQLSEEKQGKDIWPILYDSKMDGKVLGTYSGVIKIGPTFAKLPPGGAAQMTTLFHEMMHGYDDGKDGSPVEKNRMTGKYAYSPDDPDPSNHNASEKLAYTDMAKWTVAY